MQATAAPTFFPHVFVVASRHNESEKRLPKSCLVLLCKFEPVLRWTKECDNLLYQTLVEMLIPDVLRPIPSKSVRPGEARETTSGQVGHTPSKPSLSSSPPPLQVP